MDTTNKYRSAAYWTQLIQLELFDCVRNYLDANNMTQKDFAEKLGVSKGYVSQILNGDFDHKLSKLVELALACDLVPKFEFAPTRYAAEISDLAYLRPSDWKPYESFIHKINHIRTFKNDCPIENATKEIKKVVFDRTVSLIDNNVWQTMNPETKKAG